MRSFFFFFLCLTQEASTRKQQHLVTKSELHRDLSMPLLELPFSTKALPCWLWEEELEGERRNRCCTELQKCLQGRAIVLNLSEAIVRCSSGTLLAQFQSTILVNGLVERDDSGSCRSSSSSSPLVLFIVCVTALKGFGDSCGQLEMKGLCPELFSSNPELREDRAWTPANVLFGSAFDSIALWRSPKHTLKVQSTAAGRRPPHFPADTGVNAQSEEGQQTSSLSVSLNLWFADPSTNCMIHQHEPWFREIHTQIAGFGRMQKFEANRLASSATSAGGPAVVIDPASEATRYSETGLVEEVYMAPGFTHLPFYCYEPLYTERNAQERANGSDPSAADSRNARYPPHQYVADSACVWLAVEF
jgi:hypothetical protein